MVRRLLLFSGFLLILLPFVGLYEDWKIWTAFFIGLVLFVYAVYTALRDFSE